MSNKEGAGKKRKMYDVRFYELFDTKNQAVVCFLSLERRYFENLRQLERLKLEQRTAGSCLLCGRKLK